MVIVCFLRQISDESGPAQEVLLRVQLLEVKVHLASPEHMIGLYTQSREWGLVWPLPLTHSVH